MEKSGRLKQPIVTEIVHASHFYSAGDYHQDYYRKNPFRYKLYRFGCCRDARLKCRASGTAAADLARR